MITLTNNDSLTYHTVAAGSLGVLIEEIGTKNEDCCLSIVSFADSCFSLDSNTAGEGGSTLGIRP